MGEPNPLLVLFFLLQKINFMKYTFDTEKISLVKTIQTQKY